MIEARTATEEGGKKKIKKEREKAVNHIHSIILSQASWQKIL